MIYVTQNDNNFPAFDKNKNKKQKHHGRLGDPQPGCESQWSENHGHAACLRGQKPINWLWVTLAKGRFFVFSFQKKNNNLMV